MAFRAAPHHSIACRDAPAAAAVPPAAAPLAPPPCADAADGNGVLQWPRVFHEPPLPEAVRAGAAHDLLRPAPGVFVRCADSTVLSRDCAAGAWLGAFAECGEAGCACNRLTQPAVRRQFREAIVRHVLRALHQGGERPTVRYVGLGSGLLLSDAELLCALQEGGATIESITLVDADCPRKGSHQRAVPSPLLRCLCRDLRRCLPRAAALPLPQRRAAAACCGGAPADGRLAVIDLASCCADGRRRSKRDVAALAQMSSLFAPATLTACACRTVPTSVSRCVSG
jgi:hypothetical protein